MDLRHAAALALVGWYLMLPPFQRGGVNLDAPLDMATFLEVTTPQTTARMIAEMVEKGKHAAPQPYNGTCPVHRLRRSAPERKIGDEPPLPRAKSSMGGPMGFKIEQGEKFALLAFSGLTVGIDDQTPNPADLGFSFGLPANCPFLLMHEWREQLGKTVSSSSETDATSCWQAASQIQRDIRRRKPSSERAGSVLFQGLAVSAGVPTFRAWSANLWHSS